MGKFLRVFFVSAVMAALCLVPALAVPVYPSELPSVPDFQNFLDEGVSISNDDIFYIVTADPDYPGEYYLFFMDNPSAYYIDSDGVRCFDTTALNLNGTLWFDGSAWSALNIMKYRQASNALSWGTLSYSNCTLYNSDGSVLSEGGYPSSGTEPDPEPDPEPGLFLPSDLIPSGYPDYLPAPPNFELYSSDNVTTNNLFVYYLVFEDSSGEFFLIATLDPWDNMTYYKGTLYPLDDPETGKTLCSTFRWVDDQWVCLLPMDYHDIDSAFVSGGIAFGDFTPVSDKPDDDMIPYEGPKPIPPKPEVPSHSYQTAVGDDGEVEDPEVEPGTPMEDLNLVVGSIFGILTQIYNLYAGTWLLTGFLMLWLIRKVAKLFNKL